jgi:hypothetical protein
MSAIPEFEERERYPFAVLPDGVYPCDESTLNPPGLALPGYARGLLEMKLDDAARAPVVGTERSAPRLQPP